MTPPTPYWTDGQITLYCGDLDVFAGGCSTLVAARNSGRRAVGIELREEQCAKAVEWRLAQAVLPFEGAS